MLTGAKFLWWDPGSSVPRAGAGAVNTHHLPSGSPSAPPGNQRGLEHLAQVTEVSLAGTEQVGQVEVGQGHRKAFRHSKWSGALQISSFALWLAFPTERWCARYWLLDIHSDLLYVLVPGPYR